MIFSTMPPADAEGAILAHGLRVGAVRLKKGHLLSDHDVETLVEAGVSEVTAFRLEDSDIREDEAAERIGDVLAGKNIRKNAAFTGRCNLYADVPGILVYAPEHLDAFNLVDEALTVAMLPPFTTVQPGQMIATVKIIPFAVDQSLLDRAARKAQAVAPRVSPFQRRKTMLIETTLAHTGAKVSKKLNQATRSRLAELGAELTAHITCPHDVDSLAEAIRTEAANTELLLIAGASATTDRRDVVPAALESAGGHVIHFGMPVDPGNLLLLGSIGGLPVIGLPGCARSPKLNGFDRVLQRIVGGIDVSGEDIMRMGSGGLLKEIGSRPQPRSGAEGEEGAARAPKIAAIIMAAGTSSRMKGENKLLIEIAGKPMVRNVAEAAIDSAASSVVVVTGRDAQAMEAALAGLAVSTVHNPAYADGMAGSLRTGLNALPEGADGVLICLGDMPLVTPEHLNRLISAFDPEEGRSIIVPSYQGKWGNPVLWGAAYFDEIRSITGDKGARELLHTHAERVYDVAFDDDAILRDFDTPQAIEEHQP